jgi:hypothetical protein
MKYYPRDVEGELASRDAPMIVKSKPDPTGRVSFKSRMKMMRAAEEGPNKPPAPSMAQTAATNLDDLAVDA